MKNEIAQHPLAHQLCRRPDQRVRPGSSLETQLAEVQLNVMAVMGLAYALLPNMRAHRSGGIFNVASTVAFQSFAYMTTYAATKSFVLSLSESLWAENRRSGVHRFFKRMGTNLPEPLERYGPPMPVVCDGLDALAVGISSKVSGAKNFLVTQAPRLLPRQAIVALGERLAHNDLQKRPEESR